MTNMTSRIYKAFALISGCMVLNSVFHSRRTRRSQENRQLSLDLGNGNCKWQPPLYEVPDDIEFYKTIIAGYPSGDKRLTFVQMEALTGYAAKDEWDFQYLGMSNHPFIKANYPHHEGIWGWEDAGDQVILVVRNMRRSMVEYHDILWDIGYAKTWEQASELLTNLYAERPPLDDFRAWRDLRVMDEVHWYGWFIDYWMEAGLMRDIMTHKITTPHHFEMIKEPTIFSKDEIAYDVVVGPDTVVTPSYDPHCVNDVSGGCHPVQIISAEHLVETSSGPAEGRKLGNVLMNNDKMKEHVINETAWECIWTELIVNKKGLKTFIDRAGVGERDYSFSVEMLGEMLHEFDRLIAKYGASEWNAMQTSKDLVVLLTEHRALVQAEYEEVDTEVLLDSDFLGPKERKRRKLMRLEEELSFQFPDVSSKGAKDRRMMEVMNEEKKDYSDFFAIVDKKLAQNRKATIKSEVFADDRNYRDWDSEERK